MSLNVDEISIAVALSAFLAYHENSVDCATIKEFHLEDLSKDKKLSVNTLMEEENSIVVKN